MPPLTLLIKPASGMCNLDCVYCFYHDISKKRLQESFGMMSLETMEQVIRRAFEFAEGHITFAFQGGEPTLIGIPFYEEAIKLIDQYNHKKIKVHYALQTNGYLLSEEWGAFFHKHHFLVGLSVDGTIHTHNAYRKTGAGKETFQEIMKTAQMLERYKVEFNVLTVVNKKTAAAIGKIYKFYKKNHFSYLQFIPCLDPFEEKAGKMEYSLTPEKYGQFLCDLFDLWYEDLVAGDMVSIRQFDNYIGMLKGYPPESCDMNGVCGIQNVIEADGSVYPCDFYVHEKYKLGNIYDQSITDMHEKRKELQFVEESIITNAECKACPYFLLCRGGCKRHRMMASMDDYQHNYFCDSFRVFFTYATERMLEISKRIRL